MFLFKLIIFFREELKKFNEKFGLVHISKLKFYGEYRKDQLEKYKTSTNISKLILYYKISRSIHKI